jgi:hypothetical protein
MIGAGFVQPGHSVSYRIEGLSGKRSPHQFYCGQPQLGEEQLDAGRVAGIGCSHAASTSWTVLSSS